MQRVNNSVRYSKTPKSMNQAFCWMPDGKCVRPDNRNWAIKPQKVRSTTPVQIVCDKSKVFRNAHLAVIRKQQIVENRKRLGLTN